MILKEMLSRGCSKAIFKWEVMRVADGDGDGDDDSDGDDDGDGDGDDDADADADADWYFTFCISKSLYTCSNFELLWMVCSSLSSTTPCVSMYLQLALPIEYNSAEIY